MLDAIVKADPAVVEHVRENLPKGPQGAVEDYRVIKWDYALVFYHDIEKIRESVVAGNTFPGRIAACRLYQTFVDDYRGPATYSCHFDNLLSNLPRSPESNSGLKMELHQVDKMRDALAQDVAEFKGECPPYYDNLDRWKHHTVYRMLQDMEMDRVDHYRMVKRVYDQYNYCKSNHRSEDQFRQMSAYGTTANFMTLLERMQYLEQRVIDLEARLSP